MSNALMVDTSSLAGIQAASATPAAVTQSAGDQSTSTAYGSLRKEIHERAVPPPM